GELAGARQRAGRRARHARGGLRRRRPDDADVGEREPGEGVEHRGLAGAGPPDERDDGVVDAELESLDDPHEVGAGAVAHLAVETAARPVDGVTDLLHPSAQLGPHLTGHTYSRSSLARNRSRVAASDGSTSMSSRALRNSSASAATAAAAHSARSSRIRAAAAVPASPSSRCTAREAPSTPAAADSTRWLISMPDSGSDAVSSIVRSPTTSRHSRNSRSRRSLRAVLVTSGVTSAASW